MRIELFVAGLTSFFIYNAYHDGKYTKFLMAFKKYYKMGFYLLLGAGAYYALKRNPQRGKELLYYANDFAKYMPLDRNTTHWFNPLFDLTNFEKGRPSFMEEFNGISSHTDTANVGSSHYAMSAFAGQHPPTRRGGTKRSVSETKKKYVASNQDWKCGHCHQQLDHTFEIDHKIRLEYGGTNEVDNLVALCRNCHGRKTASENM